jgi:AcrR family transcriptional regulator
MTADTSLSLRDRARRDRLVRIRLAAERLLEAKAFEDISTREIAKLAEVGEATLFRYVKSKQNLLMVVYGDKLDAILDEIERRDAATDSDGTAAGYVDRILRVYEARCALYLESPHNATLYLRSGFEPDPQTNARAIAQGDRTIDLVARILGAGQRAGLLIGSVDVRLIAQNCHATYMHEIERTPARRLDPATLWERLRPRLVVQLELLAERAGPTG